MAIHTLPGARTIRIEIYGVTPQEGEWLMKEFGGAVTECPSDAWVVAAGRQLRPLAIRKSLLIVHSDELRASEAARYPGRRILLIPSGVAFGTGDHATTASCLRLLADEAVARETRPWHMLDAGCGTGILALAACLLGAHSALGIDNDPDAIRAARTNAKANQIKRSTFKNLSLSDLPSLPTNHFEVLAANVFSEALIASAPALVAITAPGGLIIISGILRTQEAETLAAFTAQGSLDMENVVRRGKWIAASFRKLSATAPATRA